MPSNASTIVSEAGKSMVPHNFSGPIHAAEARGFHPYYSSPLADLEYTPHKSALPKSWKTDHEKNNVWSRKFQEQECSFCGGCRDIRGSSSYTGKGIFSYLVDVARDPPSHSTKSSDTHLVRAGRGTFCDVPRPPKDWYGLNEDTLANGEKEPEDGSWSFGTAPRPNLQPLKDAIREAFAADSSKAQADLATYDRDKAIEVAKSANGKDSWYYKSCPYNKDTDYSRLLILERTEGWVEAQAIKAHVVKDKRIAKKPELVSHTSTIVEELCDQDTKRSYLNRWRLKKAGGSSG